MRKKVTLTMPLAVARSILLWHLVFLIRQQLLEEGLGAERSFELCTSPEDIQALAEALSGTEDIEVSVAIKLL